MLRAVTAIRTVSGRSVYGLVAGASVCVIATPSICQPIASPPSLGWGPGFALLSKGKSRVSPPLTTRTVVKDVNDSPPCPYMRRRPSSSGVPGSPPRVPMVYWPKSFACSSICSFDATIGPGVSRCRSGAARAADGRASARASMAARMRQPGRPDLFVRIASLLMSGFPIFGAERGNVAQPVVKIERRGRFGWLWWRSSGRGRCDRRSHRPRPRLFRHELGRERARVSRCFFGVLHRRGRQPLPGPQASRPGVRPGSRPPAAAAGRAAEPPAPQRRQARAARASGPPVPQARPSPPTPRRPGASGRRTRPACARRAPPRRPRSAPARGSARAAA